MPSLTKTRSYRSRLARRRRTKCRQTTRETRSMKMKSECRKSRRHLVRVSVRGGATEADKARYIHNYNKQGKA